MSIQDAIKQILKEAGKPLHAKEITEQIIEAGLWSTDGKTPEATVSARLYSDIKKHGDQSIFVQVAPRTFSLRNVQPVAVYDAREPEPRSESPPDSSKATYSFLDAAEKVLDQFGNRDSMHSRDITDKAMKQGWLNTSGKTPEATMNAQVGYGNQTGKSQWCARPVCTYITRALQPRQMDGNRPPISNFQAQSRDPEEAAVPVKASLTIQFLSIVWRQPARSKFPQLLIQVSLIRYSVGLYVKE
ncbi:winged helix-turn-helix domain-containing protein [Olavius algarvensis spirochete endosymbiont]|uniref:winged helix-turn-helix domain-containing protein n=1 Tax=Olavius algarvensis spirochete endosymbiont TaxID=260710 RepID=UPI0018A81FBD|nr:winged helix-turn-helix domain-containing protein [Olavius algarvensis spirochete endosymbiont]